MTAAPVTRCVPAVTETEEEEGGEGEVREALPSVIRRRDGRGRGRGRGLLHRRRESKGGGVVVNVTALITDGTATNVWRRNLGAKAFSLKSHEDETHQFRRGAPCAPLVPSCPHPDVFWGVG